MKKKFTVYVETAYDVEAEDEDKARELIENQINSGTLDIDISDCWVNDVETRTEEDDDEAGT